MAKQDDYIMYVLTIVLKIKALQNLTNTERIARAGEGQEVCIGGSRLRKGSFGHCSSPVMNHGKKQVCRQWLDDQREVDSPCISMLKFRMTSSI